MVGKFATQWPCLAATSNAGTLLFGQGSEHRMSPLEASLPRPLQPACEPACVVDWEVKLSPNPGHQGSGSGGPFEERLSENQRRQAHSTQFAR